MPPQQMFKVWPPINHYSEKERVRGCSRLGSGAAIMAQVCLLRENPFDPKHLLQPFSIWYEQEKIQMIQEYLHFTALHFTFVVPILGVNLLKRKTCQKEVRI